MEIDKIIKNVYDIVSGRGAGGSDKFKKDMMMIRLLKDEVRTPKHNPIPQLGWYKKTIKDISKNSNIMRYNDIKYKYGVYVKFKNEIIIKYIPHILSTGNKIVKNTKKEKVELINNVFINFSRCDYCNRGINLKNENEFKKLNNRTTCTGCCEVFD